MAIEITEFTNVSISVSPTGVAGGNFGILGFLTVDTDLAFTGKKITSAERARAYKSLATVGGDWQAGSEVYKAATAFYAQTPTPTDFTVLMAFETAQRASLIGGGTLTAVDLVANESGWANQDFSISIDGISAVITDLSISGGLNTYAGIANELELALVSAGTTGAKVTHNGYQFVITGSATGASTGSITFAESTDASIALGLTAASAKLSQGLDAETAVEGLAANLTAGKEFIGLVTHRKFRDYTGGAFGSGQSAEDIGVWAEGAKKIFCNTTNDLTTLTSGATNTASALKGRTLRFTLTSFSKDILAYPSASIFGRAASVNFAAIGSTITLNLKQMPTVASEDLTPSEYANMKSYYCSAVVQIGKSINAFTDSRMASGSWLDTTHGLLWLENRTETDMFNLLYVNNTKLPYTQVGLNTAIGTLRRSLEAAVRNGLAGPGYLPDGTYLAEGFSIAAVSLANTPVSDKGNRLYAGLSFKMVGAGALHEITVSGEFSE
jgi:phage host-nuclease inhibitor protein Gam